MGFTRIQIDVGVIEPEKAANGFQKKGSLEVRVDSGATYSTLPGETLRQWGFIPHRDVVLRIADGRQIKRPLGYCGIQLEGVVIQTPVLFGQGEDPLLLGTIALEDANFMIDPVTRQLLHGTSYIQY